MNEGFRASGVCGFGGLGFRVWGVGGVALGVWTPWGFRVLGLWV